MNSKFKQWTDKDVVDLIESNPLALMVTTGGGEFRMTPLPMLADTDANGRLTRLVGHMALSNSHAGVLRDHPRAHFLFLGPNDYISPRLVENPSWAPTWNYAVAWVEAEVVFQPDKLETALQRLVEKLESGEPDAWSVEELGDRYERLKRRIVAFDADVLAVDATFKLGQDEQPEAFRQIVSGLQSEELRLWMQRFRGSEA